MNLRVILWQTMILLSSISICSSGQIFLVENNDTTYQESGLNYNLYPYGIFNKVTGNIEIDTNYVLILLEHKRDFLSIVIPKFILNNKDKIYITILRRKRHLLNGKVFLSYSIGAGKETLSGTLTLIRRWIVR